MALRRFVPHLSLDRRKSGDEIEKDRNCTYCSLPKTNDRRMYTQRVRGFQQVSEKYSGETAIFFCAEPGSGVRAAVPST